MSITPDVVGAIVTWLVVVALFVFRAGRNLERRRQRRRARRYSFTWQCPDCRFEVGGTDPGVVLTITTVHERSHR